MEFNEKLQELRKQKGLTQEELAQELFVSRAAVSKWESGRGYPNIDSLKAISIYFQVSVDALLSGEEVLNIAENACAEKEQKMRDCVFALLDCSVLLLAILPVFGERAEGVVQTVSLIQLFGTEPYLQICFWAVTLVIGLWGCLILMLRNCSQRFWMQQKYNISFLLNGIGTLLFIISLQPYAAVILFLSLMVKLLIFRKKL